jgi:LytR cell envelope-related transcriptional attenuator
MSAQVVKGVLHSGLLSNPIKLLNVVSDAAASMTTDAGMSATDLVHIGQSFRDLSGQNVQFITAPNEPWTQNPNRIQLLQPQASEVFAAIARDRTVPKVSAAPSASAQVLTTSPANVRVEVLNGSGVPRIASQAAAGLTRRGFSVTGTGEAPNFSYTTSVIEYSTAADMAAVNTLKSELTNVTALRVASLAPGTVELILGSSFTGLAPQTPPSGTTPAVQSFSPATSPASSPASPSASASASGVTGLAGANGITAAAACTADSGAFSGPLSP